MITLLFGWPLGLLAGALVWWFMDAAEPKNGLTPRELDEHLAKHPAESMADRVMREWREKYH